MVHRLESPPNPRGLAHCFWISVSRGSLGGRVDKHWDSDGLRAIISIPVSTLQSGILSDLP